LKHPFVEVTPDDSKENAFSTRHGTTVSDVFGYKADNVRYVKL